MAEHVENTCISAMKTGQPVYSPRNTLKVASETARCIMRSQSSHKTKLGVG
jgi:hypothetical protein